MNEALPGLPELPPPVPGHKPSRRRVILWSALASVVVHGKSYDLKTNSLRPADKAKSASAKSSDQSKEKAKQKNDNSTLSAKSKLTFKLSEPVSVPMKG